MAGSGQDSCSEILVRVRVSSEQKSANSMHREKNIKYNKSVGGSILVTLDDELRSCGYFASREGYHSMEREHTQGR